MTLSYDGAVVNIETARDRLHRLDQVQRPQRLTVVKPRQATTVNSMTRTEKHVRDIVWTAVISIILATTALAAGVAGVMFGHDLVQLAEGAGLSSIAFSLLSLADKFDVHRFRRED